MLTEFDDYFIHQTVDTIDHVANGDPRFQDRLYFNVHGHSDAFLLNMGIGAFPNQNVMDGYVCAAVGTKQYNVRFSRPLDHDRWKMFAGPMHLEILEPMKRWHVWLEPNEHQISFDLVFTARTLPLEHHPIYQREGGYVVWHQQHLQQGGTYEGWVEIAGQRMPARDLWGSRDRTWGVRGPQPGTSLSANTAPRAVASLWMSAQFPSFTVHCWAGKEASGRNLYIDGTRALAGSAQPLEHFVNWSYEVHKDAAGCPTNVTLSFTLESGEVVTIAAEPAIAVDLRGTGYMEGFFGRKRTAVHVEGESWDFADADVRKRLGGTQAGDVLCSFKGLGEQGWGVFESQLLRIPA